MKNQKGYVRWVVIILICVMAIGLVGAAWYYEENKDDDASTIVLTVNTNTAVTNINSVINTNTDVETNYLLDETNDGQHITVYGHTFEYPDTWLVQQNDTSQIRYTDEIVEFIKNNTSIAALSCPYPEVGYELWKFEDKTRNYEHDGETYGAKLRVGVPNKDVIGAGDTQIGNKYIIYMYRGNELKDYQPSVCSLSLSDTDGSKQEIANQIYNSINQY